MKDREKGGEEEGKRMRGREEKREGRRVERGSGAGGGGKWKERRTESGKIERKKQRKEEVEGAMWGGREGKREEGKIERGK